MKELHLMFQARKASREYFIVKCFLCLHSLSSRVKVHPLETHALSKDDLG